MRRLSATTLLGASEASAGHGAPGVSGRVGVSGIGVGCLCGKGLGVGVWRGVARSALGFCVVVCRAWAVVRG